MRDLGAPDLCDLLLALRASHESKGDLEGVPAVLEKVVDAVGMKDVPAPELHTGLFSQLARVADHAELFIVGKARVGINALGVEAREAVHFTCYTIAGMTTVSDPVALLDQRLFFCILSLLQLIFFLFLYFFFGFLLGFLFGFLFDQNGLLFNAVNEPFMYSLRCWLCLRLLDLLHGFE